MAPRPPNPNHPLVRARTRIGYQQKDAASKLGVSPNTLGRYERGDRQPDAALLERMAKLYRVPVDDLLATASVPRETRSEHGRVREPSTVYNVRGGGHRQTLLAIEQMALALAKVAREALDAQDKKA